MDPLRMVPLVTAGSPMEAKVLAARLGAEGIVWEFRGSVDGPFALGPIDVLVDAEAYDSARELLILDELEASLSGPSGVPVRQISRGEWLWIAVVVVLVVLFVVARMAARV